MDIQGANVKERRGDWVYRKDLPESFLICSLVLRLPGKEGRSLTRSSSSPSRPSYLSTETIMTDRRMGQSSTCTHATHAKTTPLFRAHDPPITRIKSSTIELISEKKINSAF